jgi:hypothetical protein
MFPQIPKRLVALAIGGLSYLVLCIWVATDRTPQPTAASAIEAEKALEAKRQEMFVKYSREAAEDAASRKREAEQQAMQKQAMENGRRGCLDDRSNAYLQLPLKVVDPVFRPCAASLLNNTNIPLILPPNATKIHQYSSEPVTLYSYLNFNATGYEIGLTYSPRERYQLNQAYYSGEIITEKSLTLRKYYEERVARVNSTLSFKTQRQEAGAVTLINGLRGYYLPSICGANCHSAYASITWDQNGYRYSISIKMGRKEKVLEIVNAAIDNQAH